MKNFYFILSFLILTTFGYSQESNLKNTLTAEFGLNRHGTGDMTGFTYGMRYNKVLNRTFDLIFSFEGNLNDSERTPFIWEDPDGNSYNSTPHDVIAGFQIGGGIGLNILNSKKHKLGINPGFFGRYQALSTFSTTITDYPALTGYPVPIRYYIREEPGNTITTGGSLRLFYNYRLNNKYFIGFNPGFQLDFNGDTMIITTLSFGLSL